MLLHLASFEKLNSHHPGESGLARDALLSWERREPRSFCCAASCEEINSRVLAVDFIERSQEHRLRGSLSTAQLVSRSHNIHSIRNEKWGRVLYCRITPVQERSLCLQYPGRRA